MNEFPIFKMGFLTSFCLTHSEDPNYYSNAYSNVYSNTCLIIELKDKESHTKIRFNKVKDLKVNSLSSMFKMIIFIQDIHLRQLEDLNFQIMEMEDNSILFYCESFEIIE